MHTAYVIVTLMTVAANLAVAAADFAKAPFVLANSAEVGVAQRHIPILAGLKAAGAVGLLLGLLGVPLVGQAAAAGLVAFFVGAVVVHLRTHVVHNIAFPLTYLGLAVATLALSIGQDTFGL